MRRKVSKKEGTEGPSLSALMEEVRVDEGLSEIESEKEDGIVDILTFCNSPKYLNLPENGFNLFRGQATILKIYYLGSLGNEKVELTDADWGWLYEKQQHNVIQRLRSKLDGVNPGDKHNFIFKELHLAFGRRASKTILTSIIVAYEAYKLIKLGDPYEYYHIPRGEEIAIINVANSQNQANRLFAQIKERIRSAPFFRGRIDGDATASMVRMFTDVDMERKNDPNTNISVEGSIVLVCGHSNPDTLRGYSAAAIMFDEFAFYDENPKISGRAFYNALKPSILKFGKRGDGRLVEISSVNGMSGIFYEIWKNGQSEDRAFQDILSFRLATWDINDDISYDDDDLVKARMQDPAAFDVEYGSVWNTAGVNKKFFARELVDTAIMPGLAPQHIASRAYKYYVHVDPASTKDAYSLVVVYRVPYVTPRGEKRFKICLAYHQIWKPGPMGLDFKEIDNQVFDICRRFRAVSVTYDVWNSVHSVEYLRRKGLRANRLQFSRANKAQFYTNLEDLMNRNELCLYYDETIYGELVNLRYKPSMRGISIGKDERSDCPTDDLIDCLAGAAWMAIGREKKEALPSTVVANMGRL
jgi:hypothetical protein